MRVKPAPGRAIRDPKTLVMLPEDGREVPDDDLFWQRRVRDGDVTVEQSRLAAHHGRDRHAPAKEA